MAVGRPEPPEASLRYVAADCAVKPKISATSPSGQPAGQKLCDNP